MRFFLIIALLLGSLAANAQHRTAPPEFFLEIERSGVYEVRINDESSTSSRGRFRFYDLSAGRHTLTILQNGRQLYNRPLTLAEGTRTIASYLPGRMLEIREELEIIRNDNYALDNWNRYPDAGGGRPGGNNRPGYARAMPEDEFAYLQKAVKAEAFDDAKIRVMDMALRRNVISVSQLSQLLKTFSFDDRKVSAAKNSYWSIGDTGNIYRLKEAFTFSSNWENFEKFMMQQGR